MRANRTIDGVRAAKEAIWGAALRAEGFGVATGRIGEQNVDVSAEIEDMTDYECVRAFARGTINDKALRKSCVRDYALPFFPDIRKLDDTIIPTYSFFDSVVGHVAALYKGACVRWVDPEEQMDRYSEIVDQSRLNVAMKEANRAWYSYGVCSVRPVVRFDRIAGKGRLEYDVKAPNEFRVLLDDGGNVVKYLYEKWLEDQYVIVVWTPTSHYYRDTNGRVIPISGNEGLENPYGVIPAVFVHGPEFYGGGALDLYEACLEYNFARMMGIEDLAFSNLNVAVMTNCGIKQGDKIGVRQIYARDGVTNDPAADAPPSVEFASADSHTQTYVDYMNAVRTAAHIAEGVPSHYLTEQSRELSGTALRQMSKPLMDKLRDQVEVFRVAEERLHSVTRTVIALPSPAGLGVDIPGAFFVDFPDDASIDDPVKEWELLKAQMDSGIISPIDVIQRYNRDIESEEDAKAALANNRRVLREIRVAGFAPTEPLV